MLSPRLVQADEERPHSHGDQGHEGTAASKPRQLQGGNFVNIDIFSLFSHSRVTDGPYCHQEDGTRYRVLRDRKHEIVQFSKGQRVQLFLISVSRGSNHIICNTFVINISTKVLFDPCMRDPHMGSGMEKNPDPGSGINHG